MNLYTIAFYNTENLFDIFNDKYTNDDDFLPTSDKRWTKKRYERKIYKLGSVISKIGFEETQKPPAIIGLVEVENKKVIKDLINSKDLEEYNYKYIHYDSYDERGIDVACLYDGTIFQLEHSESFTVYIESEEGVRDYTRDILLVSGRINGELLHFIINHWPSRREGEQESNYKRIIAAKKVEEIIIKLRLNYQNPKIIIMGDFNDNPDDESIKYLIDNNKLFNPMETLRTYNEGSQNHNFSWNLFDQIIFTTNFFETQQENLRFYKAKIFNEKFLTQYSGKFKGHPYRTFVGKKYKGGFSDHFPVYILLQNDI